ncbi:MAG TPA: PhzF family phenazine biosynthesis protein [Solirubrobacterales bacterium]|nr:PhzF family phenazine biosynthesis protein [Solirubrobacterales bacterium]
MAELHVLRVFCAPDGSGGNPLGVFLDGAEVPNAERQRVAADLGFAETVFVDDPAEGRVRIFTPVEELDFAGHPMVGTAWLLAREREPVSRLRPPAGEVPARHEGELTFVAGRPEWGPAWEFVEVDSPREVDRRDGPPGGKSLVGVWAWIDEERGVIRERVFAPEIGIVEDEATGSAAVRLGVVLQRPLEIHQGVYGSRISARPLDDGMVEIGGRVELDAAREYPA